MTPARVAEGFANFSLVSNGDPAMKRLTLVITFVLVTLGQAQAQENRGSAKYMLPFCQTWLKVAAERDLEVRGSILKTEQPIRLTTAGMCAGLVVGVAETLRMVELACPPEHVSYEPLVRMVVAHHSRMMSPDPTPCWQNHCELLSGCIRSG
jgi:hypothetical protein